MFLIRPTAPAARTISFLAESVYSTLLELTSTALACLPSKTIRFANVLLYTCKVEVCMARLRNAVCDELRVCFLGSIVFMLY